MYKEINIEGATQFHLEFHTGSCLYCHAPTEGRKHIWEQALKAAIADERWTKLLPVRDGSGCAEIEDLIAKLEEIAPSLGAVYRDDIWVFPSAVKRLNSLTRELEEFRVKIGFALPLPSQDG